MLIGITVGQFNGVRPSLLLQIAKKFGVEFVEFNRSLLDDIEAVAATIGDTASGYHLPLMEEDGFDFSCHNYKDKIDEVIEALNKYKNKLNIRYAVTHPPQPELADTEIESTLEFWLENLRRVQIPILIENVTTWGEKDFDHIQTILRENLGDRFAGVCFDGPHSLLRGEDVFIRFRDLAPQVRCIHLSDCSSSEDLHLPFKQGGIFPVMRFLKFAKATGIRPVINLEINPGSLESLRALIESYLTVLKVYQPGRYLIARLRMLWAVPSIKKHLRQLVQTANTSTAS